MSKFIKSYCVKPVYLLENKSQASVCGTYNSLLTSILIFLFIGIAAYKIYNKKDSKEINKIHMILTISFVILFIILPIFTWFGKQVEWNGYKDAYKQLLDEGYNQKDAMAIISGFDSKSQLPSFGVGSTIAGSLFLTKQKDTKKQNNETKENE